MAVSVSLIRNAESLEYLRILESQIMDGSSMWISAFQRRIELGGSVSEHGYRLFPDAFPEENKLIREKYRKIQKDGFLELSIKIRNKSLTFKDIEKVFKIRQRFRIPEKVFLNCFISMFDEIEDYSSMKHSYCPVWYLFDYFNLKYYDEKYQDWNKYTQHWFESKKIYDANWQRECSEAMD